MPEGPSIIILKEQVLPFKGKRITKVEGNSKIDLKKLEGQKIIDFKTWGKHLLICFKDFSVRIHLMLFGSYRINERREKMAPRLSLQFAKGELNFYNCSVKTIEGDLDAVYDWEVDTMSDKWSPSKALKALKNEKVNPVCDALLNQNIFAGVGNIIKNEVLFKVKIHPESIVGSIPLKKRRELVDVTRHYCFDFYRWRKAFELRKHWLVYRQKMCVRCQIPLIFKHLGKNLRRSYYCANCQKLYSLKARHK